MKKISSIFIILFSTFFWADDFVPPKNLPPWLSPELVVHISAMEMTEYQSTEFREGLMDCLSGLQSVVQREIRKGGVNIPKRIKRGISREYSKFDERMKSELEEEQVVHWELYLEGLKKLMEENSAKR